MSLIAFFLFLLSLTYATEIPTFSLHNAASPDLKMPAIGLGTGAYSMDPSRGYGVYPECFSDQNGCGNYAFQAALTWLELGGRRFDCSNSYNSDKPVGQAIINMGIPRQDIFILDKVGPTFPLGYNDTLDQMSQILADLQTSYVDLLLVHWPTGGSDPQSSDPYCQVGTSTYNERDCRISTWRAMVKLWEDGQALSIGVSNYNITHLQEIIDADLPLPSYNQCPYHLYRSSTQQQLIDFCRSHGILFGGYSPLGALDTHHYPGPTMAQTPLEDPIVIQIAQAHNVTPAQVLLQWQWVQGIPTNPRSQNRDHMTDNLNSYSFTLSENEIDALSHASQDYCSVDPNWYECSP